MQIDFSMVAAIFGIVQFIGTVVIFCVVKFNDLAHIDSKITTIIAKQDESDKKIGSLSETVSYLKGVSDASTGRGTRLYNKKKQ